MVVGTVDVIGDSVVIVGGTVDVIGASVVVNSVVVLDILSSSV